MTSLIACLTTGKGSWAQVNQLIRSQPWNLIFLITNDFGKQNYTPDATTKDKTTMIVINDQLALHEIISHMVTALQNKITDLEVAVNMISGSGKEHMALLAALIKCGYGFRLVGVTAAGQYEEL